MMGNSALTFHFIRYSFFEGDEIGGCAGDHVRVGFNRLFVTREPVFARLQKTLDFHEKRQNPEVLPLAFMRLVLWARR